MHWSSVKDFHLASTFTCYSLRGSSLVIRITLVFVGLLLGSWRMVQESWRPLLFSLAIVCLLLGFWRVAQEPWRPLLLWACFWAPGAGALAAVRSFPDERASYYFYEDDESRSPVG